MLYLEALILLPDFFGATYADMSALKTLPFERFIQSRDVDNVMFGAFLNGQLSGVCGLQREPGGKSRHRAKLVQLYVAKHASGRGIGSKLVDAVLRHAFDGLMLHQVELAVVENNSTAIRLYEKKGFREYGRMEHHFFAEGVDSTQVFMACRREWYLPDAVQ